MKGKRSVTCLFILFSSSIVNAQFTKGQRMVGASVASFVFESGTADMTVASIGSTRSVTRNYNLQISPMMGWFISPQTAVGGMLIINPNGTKVSYEQSNTTFQQDKTNGYSFGLGVFARHYLSGNNLLPFGQLSINGGLNNLKTEGFFYGGSGSNAYKQSYEGNSTGGSFVNATLTAGFTKMIAPTTGLDFYIGYSYSYDKNTFKKTTLRDLGNDGFIDERLENETTTKFTNHSLLFGIGFQVFLGKKK